MAAAVRPPSPIPAFSSAGGRWLENRSKRELLPIAIEHHASIDLGDAFEHSLRELGSTRLSEETMGSFLTPAPAGFQQIEPLHKLNSLFRIFGESEHASA
jgi:hypothetical protein